MTEPWDQWNQALVANVRPADWVNPTPAPGYNLVVIGAGTAGLVTAAGAAGLGARVALIERHRLGGDCLNYGCVPSKALIRSAKDARPDFAAAMERMRRLRAQISPHDSAQRFKGLGVDVFFGDARFVNSRTIEVGNQKLRFVKAVIATGARPVVPANYAGCLTNETVFNLTQLPRDLLVIGGGPIGCELAQMFRRFGSRVRLAETHDRLLHREDAEAAAIVQSSLARDGVEFLFNTRIQEVRERDGKKVAVVRSTELVADGVLIGAGRAPNVEGLNLEAAGVEYSSHGVHVNERLRTTNHRIFAAGDICLPFKFTHTADATARIVIQNALFGGRKTWTDLVVPRCTYTDPELAHVGLGPNDTPVQTVTERMSSVDRAVLDGETEGLLKVHLRPGTDRILGGTLVARHAGEIISELTLAITAGIGLKRVSQTIHCYPTQAEIIKRAADAYNRSRLTPRLRRWFERYFYYVRK
jgi:pyruvate/2-oxoglutarate dehydrogenase complex dihydrolipoamide dehydrogenase (E3) component